MQWVDPYKSSEFNIWKGVETRNQKDSWLRLCNMEAQYFIWVISCCRLTEWVGTSFVMLVVTTRVTCPFDIYWLPNCSPQDCRHGHPWGPHGRDCALVHVSVPCGTTKLHRQKTLQPHHRGDLPLLLWPAWGGKNRGQRFNSLAPERFRWNFEWVIFKLISVIDGWGVTGSQWVKLLFWWIYFRKYKNIFVFSTIS